jgi:hypothetical protein
MRVLCRSMMAEAAVHSVDGGVARSQVRGRVFRSCRVPVHTVGSCSSARGRNSERGVNLEKSRMLSCVGCLVSLRERGFWSFLVRRLAGHRSQAAARYTAAGVRYPNA